MPDDEGCPSPITSADARFGRIHPFMISFINQRDVAVPYLGLWAVADGKKKASPLTAAVRALGGQVG